VCLRFFIILLKIYHVLIVCTCGR